MLPVGPMQRNFVVQKINIQRSGVEHVGCPHVSELKWGACFKLSMGSSGFSIVGLLGLICLPYVMLVVTDNIKEKPHSKHRNHPGNLLAKRRKL
jgi:hypothetical protein